MRPLTPAVFDVLLALADGERHGYAIMREVTESNRRRMGPGTVYGTLKRLLDAGLVEQAAEREDPELNDERRRYYRLTEQGKLAAIEEASRLQALLRVAKLKTLLRTEF